MKSKQTEAEHEAREKDEMGAGYEAHEKSFKGEDDETPRTKTAKGFDHKQLTGTFMAEHHRAADVTRTPDRFKGTHNSGPVLRVSGHANAHQIGKKK